MIKRREPDERRDFGRLLSKAIPVTHDTPPDFLRLLEKLG